MKIQNANKWKYKPQRMGRGEEAGVERNFSTAINRGESRAHGLLLVTYHELRTTPEEDSVITIDSSPVPSTTRP